MRFLLSRTRTITRHKQSKIDQEISELEMKSTIYECYCINLTFWLVTLPSKPLSTNVIRWQLLEEPITCRNLQYFTDASHPRSSLTHNSFQPNLTDNQVQ
jgi:hypothetical protein